MMEEILPVLEEQNGIIKVTGRAKRSEAHGSSPLLHATAVIAAALPDGTLLFADKTKKQAAKNSLPAGYRSGVRIVDIFGGHLPYKDLTEEDIMHGLTEQTFRKCAIRELSEELLLPDAGGVCRPYPVDENRLHLIGFYRMENDHNRELSAAYLYLLPRRENYISEDTLIQNGQDLNIPQPVIYLSPEQAIREYFSSAPCTLYFDDAIGRILEPDHGEKLLALLRRLTKMV